MADIRDPKEIIAARVAKELKDGDVVNLGNRSSYHGGELPS